MVTWQGLSRVETKGQIWRKAWRARYCPSLQQQPQEHPRRRLAAHDGDRIDERDLLRAHLDTVLRLAAPLDAPVTHHCVEPLCRVKLSARVQVEEAHLVERCGANEVARGI